VGFIEEAVGGARSKECEVNEPLLLIDTPYLCHRSWHVMKNLSFGDRGTGAIFGVLRDIVSLQDTFKTTRCVFAFDLGRSRRAGILPTYKTSRYAHHAEESDEEKAARSDFQEQIKHLRERHLPDAGFRNVFAAEGFEADDIIAQFSAALPREDEAIIISSDQDLWQCLRPNVWIWNLHTQKTYTLKHFRIQWGLEPKQWAYVKAYAGCGTDDIPGISGIGEVTAAKYLRGDLGCETKAYAKLSTSSELWKRNIGLVRLPFVGTPKFAIQPDEVTEEKWCALADSLGMPSIRDTVPRVATDKKSKGRKRNGFGFNHNADAG